ncbi:hypothetical protein HDU86_006410, partial [Geranomyces michiganensis]
MAGVSGLLGYGGAAWARATNPQGSGSVGSGLQGPLARVDGNEQAKRHFDAEKAHLLAERRALLSVHQQAWLAQNKGWDVQEDLFHIYKRRKLAAPAVPSPVSSPTPGARRAHDEVDSGEVGAESEGDEDEATVVEAEEPVDKETPDPTAAKAKTTDEKVLSLATLRERFGNIKKFHSAKDLLFGRANLSKWARDAQSHLLKECEAGFVPSWRVADIADILLLNNIALFSAEYVPSFIAKTNRPAIANIWTRARTAFAKERMRMSLPPSVADVVLPFCNDLCSGRAMESVLKVHLQKAMNLEQAVEGMTPIAVLLVIRSFYMAITKMQRLLTFASASGFPDEDTEVHAILHTLLEEIFDDDALFIVGAN